MTDTRGGAGVELDVERLARAMEDVFPGWLEEAPGTAEAQTEMRSYAEQLDAAYRFLYDSAASMHNITDPNAPLGWQCGDPAAPPLPREDGLDFPWPQEGDTDSLWTILTRPTEEGGDGWEEHEATVHLRAVWQEATAIVAPPPLTPDHLAELRRLAEEARVPDAERVTGNGWYGAGFFRALIDGDDGPLMEDADAAYIEAVSPDVVLALIADRDEAVRREARVRTALEAIAGTRRRTSECPTPGDCLYPQHHSGDESFAVYADRLRSLARAALQERTP